MNKRRANADKASQEQEAYRMEIEKLKQQGL